MFFPRTMWCPITRLDLVLLLLSTAISQFEVFHYGTMVCASPTCEQCNNAKQSEAIQWNQVHAARRLLSGSVTIKAAAAPSFVTQAPLSLPHDNVSVFSPTIALVPPSQADPSSDSKTAKPPAPPVPPALTPATTVLAPDPSPPAVNDPSDGSESASFPPPAIPVTAKNPPAAAAAAAAAAPVTISVSPVMETKASAPAPKPSTPAPVSDPSDGSKTPPVASFFPVSPTPPVTSIPPVPPPVSPAIPVDTKPSAPPPLIVPPSSAHAPPVTIPVSPVMETKPSAPAPKPSTPAPVSDPSDGSKTPPVASFLPVSPTPPVTSIPPVPPPVSPAIPVDTKPSAPPPLIVPPSSAPAPPSSPTQFVQPPPSSPPIQPPTSLVSSAPTLLLHQSPPPLSSSPSQSTSESPAEIPTTTPSFVPTTSLLPPPSSSSPPSQSAAMPTITPPSSPTTLFQLPPSSSSSPPTPSTAVMPVLSPSSAPTISMQPPTSSSSPPSPTPVGMPILTPSSAPATSLQPPPSSPPGPSTTESPAVIPSLTPLSAPTTSLQPPAAESPAVMPILTPSSAPTTSSQPPPSPSAAESPAVLPILTPSSAPTTSSQPPPSPSAAESPAVPILTPLSAPTISMQPPSSSSSSRPSPSTAESPTLTPSSSPPALMQPPRSSSSPSSPSTASPPTSLEPISPSSSNQGPVLSPNFENIPPINSSPLSPEASPVPLMATNPVPSPFISNAPAGSTIPLPPSVPRRIAPAPLPFQSRFPLSSPAVPASPSLSPGPSVSQLPLQSAASPSAPVQSHASQHNPPAFAPIAPAASVLPQSPHHSKPVGPPPSTSSQAPTVLAPTPGASLDVLAPAAAAPVSQGIISPVSVLASPKARPAQPPTMIIFPPPPNSDCHKQCTDPFVTTLPGGPCACVIPIRVGLALAVPVYGFLPLVSELAKELAAGTFLLQSQVQIVGANAVGEDLDNTEVQFSLVPVFQSFANVTAVNIAQRFWTHRVFIDGTLFGNYTVLYVIYPGLPPFNTQGSLGTSNGDPSNGNTFTEQPVGVDIQKKKNPKFGAGIIVVITLTCAIAALLSFGLIWFLVTKCHCYRTHASLLETTVESSITRRSAALLSSSSRSSSLSFASSFAPFTGSVRTFGSSELEKATENFKPSNVIGEGGFGRVYYGVLEDQTKIAVKVLIRNDHQGDREFAAEVEMLSRLHHRNLVKLVGICTEDRMRSLVYELIRNGSVESHLHGADKEIAPLNWEARLKIALGAARALAYLHEDSYPRIIHRDFKSSNILLEEDFTPKVSDFGLAKAASEELTGHISTRVMGTFGYVAPEYAMTGHLLVKSDVYSYGVVLLELLSGRRPVDMSRPPGQENLVTWARPLLIGREGLQILMDPDLESSVSFENLARVAVIASMCVQPEVSHRPFMSEVVQALKLVWNDTDDGGDEENMSTAQGTPVSDNGYREYVLSRYKSNSGGAALDRRPLSASAVLSNSSRLIRQFSGSAGRHSDPEPPKTMSGIAGYPNGGSVSEHGIHRHKGEHMWS